MSTGEVPEENSADRGMRLAAEWARDRAEVAELCRLRRSAYGLSIRRFRSGRDRASIQAVVGAINPDLEDDLQAVLTRWHQILGGSYTDAEDGRLLRGFVRWARSDELTDTIFERGLGSGEVWSMERATSDELRRLTEFGRFLYDMYPEDWESRLLLLLRHDDFELDAAVPAVRLINPGQGSDEESAIAYWRQIAGEEFCVEIIAELVEGFLVGAIQSARRRTESDDPAPGGRLPRGIRLRRRASETKDDAPEDV